jgi:hypothetical protein
LQISGLEQNSLVLLTGWVIVQLEDGDIICYQKALTREEEESLRYPDVPSFLEYVRNRQVVFFFKNTFWMKLQLELSLLR